jgi:hypothetical protein
MKWKLQSEWNPQTSFLALNVIKFCAAKRVPNTGKLCRTLCVRDASFCAPFNIPRKIVGMPLNKLRGGLYAPSQRKLRTLTFPDIVISSGFLNGASFRCVA